MFSSFLLSVTSSFQCRDLSSLWLNLFPTFFFFFFVAIGNGIAYLISCSDDSLLTCNNATDVLYLDCVSCSFAEFISSHNLLVDSLGFSVYKIMPSASSDSLTSSFPNLDALCFFLLPDCFS